MLKALVHWCRLSDQPKEMDFVGFSTSGKMAVVRDGQQERKVPRNCVQVSNGYYHDNPNRITESPGLNTEFTILSGEVAGRFGVATEVFSGDSFQEALEKAKKSGAVNVQRVL